MTKRPSLRKTRRNALMGLLTMALLALGAASSLHAQFYNGSQLTFGKNRVQHQNFNWQYLRADQYDVYFYPTGKALAQYTYYKVPEYIREIEKLLNYTSRRKLQFIVYNTQQDFCESNFAYDDEEFYNQGGVTNIYGTKIYLYFDGNRAHFDAMIRAGIMNVYAHWLVQGATVSSNMSSDYLINVPNWFYNGLSSYFGQSWNSDVDAHVKNGILTQRYADFEELSPLDATYAGHSFWKYIVDIYGENAIAQVLYRTRTTKTIERGFAYATNVRFRELLVNWYKYYYVMYHPDTKREQLTDEGIVKRPRPRRDYNNIRLSPYDESYAYVTNELGQIRVWFKSPDKNSPRCIFRRYAKTEESPDLSFPLIAWHPDGGVLGMTLEDKGHCYYYPYNLESRKWEKRFLVDVEKITSWSYSPDGRMMLFSGFKNGQSDIYLYSFLARSFTNLTQDFYDDYDPVFLNSKQIVFSSNRPVDTVGLDDDFMEATPQKHYDLFLYDYGTKDPGLLRVTDTRYADEYAARRTVGQQFVYLSDNDGLVNRYVAQFDSAVSRIDTAIHYAHFAKTRPLTDRAYSILEQDYEPYSNRVADITLKGKAKRICLSELDLTNRAEPSFSVYRNKLRNEEIARTRAFMTEDSVRLGTKEKPREHGFVQVYERDERYGRSDADSASANNRKEEFYIPVGSGYRVQYTVNKVVTQADFSFLNTSYQQFEGGTSPIYLNTGFNALVMFGITDLFEDYRITGGLRLSFNLRSNEVMFSYENLARRLDRQIVLYHQSITSQDGDNVYKQGANSIFYILKYPFNKVNSLRLSLKGRYETNVVGSLSDNTLREPNTRHLWAGVKLEYIYDDSKTLYTNLWRGSKVKIFAEYEQRAERDTRNLLVVGLDARRSFKIYRNMTFALRAAASTNVGSARLVYFMGGVDNWINAKFDRTIWVDQSKDYAYQTLATNMRGFQQNIRNGTSFVLLSGELRIPFVQLIAGHQIGFELLNSMQLNLFGDFGTAWTGITPYSKDNCLYTRYIDSGPIHAMIRRQVDPFVGGFGLGLRVSVLGYLLRFDYAWGVEDLKITNKKGMFLFSLGTDF
ncbi:MAG: PD40 domain-containing protein [Bacteroidales bacterium]|nr:PD40 domain-containing protein [Bacteroidales bacterium]